MATTDSISKLGAVPTPPPIISYIVQVLLDYWIEFRESVQAKGKLNILDPAVGDGRFLIDFSRNYHKCSNKDDLKEILCCYGLDINPDSIESACNNFDERKDKKPSDLSLKVGNALLGFLSSPKGWNRSWTLDKLNSVFISTHNIKEINFQRIKHAFHWFLEWPEVISNNGFDIILGNPPYGVNFSHNEKILFRKLYQAFDPELESYILFLERSISLLRDKGLLGMIIPNNLLTNYHYRNIRQFLLQNVKILKIVNFDGQIFPGFHVETCIIVLQRRTHKNERDNNNIQFELIKNTLDSPYNPLVGNVVIQKSIRDNPYELLLPTPDNRIQIILEKIQKNSIPLGKIVRISRGIELGFTSPLTSDNMLNSEYVPLVAGRTIRKFRLDKNIRYIRFDKNNKAIFKDINQYLQPKLMLRRIGHELIAVYDPNQHFCVCDVYIIILKPNRPPSELIYLEALLNSKLMSFYLMQRFTSVKSIFPKIPIKFLKDLPIKIPSHETKILNKVQDLHNMPWSIQEASSNQLKCLDNLNLEIFKIYEINNQERELINNSFN
ncbi:MAG: N-6 DNA methylase [Candidatus Heimdallarchaeota archaeon]|nr:MAG: N-6 DNA methylase [Candidatus Heimdallarchaeota archaeon]